MRQQPMTIGLRDETSGWELRATSRTSKTKGRRAGCSRHPGTPTVEGRGRDHDVVAALTARDSCGQASMKLTSRRSSVFFFGITAPCAGSTRHDRDDLDAVDRMRPVVGPRGAARPISSDVWSASSPGDHDGSGAARTRTSACRCARSGCRSTDGCRERASIRTCDRNSPILSLGSRAPPAARPHHMQQDQDPWSPP